MALQSLLLDPPLLLVGWGEGHQSECPTSSAPRSSCHLRPRESLLPPPADLELVTGLCKGLFTSFSPLGKLADRAIYFTFRNFFFLFFLFKFFFTMSKAISVSTGLIFTIFHQMEDTCVNFLHTVQFFRFLKGRCHGNQFCVTGKTQTTCDF